MLRDIQLPPGLVNIGDYAFSGCYALTELVVPGSVGRVPYGAFYGCENLKDLRLEEGITSINDYAFSGCRSLTNLVLPASLTKVGYNAFDGGSNINSVTLSSSFSGVYNSFRGCDRITSLYWKGTEPIQQSVIKYFNNPNLLVNVYSSELAPEDVDNIIVTDTIAGTRTCQNLALRQGYPFKPETDFIAHNSSLTIDFFQTTPMGGCAGWQTVLAPFDVVRVYSEEKETELTPFAAVTNIANQTPFWLYEANSSSEWNETATINGGTPYLIAMPNNAEYDPRYCVSGPVTFYGAEDISISPASLTDYSLTWPSGHQFRSLWMPLTEEEANNAMGLNVGINYLTNDEGEELAPGSAFHAGVTPKPLEGYVTRVGTRMSLPVIGAQSHVELLAADNDLGVGAEDGTIWLKSDRDRTLGIYRVDGVCVRTVNLRAGETLSITDLPRGLYLIAGRKLLLR